VHGKPIYNNIKPACGHTGSMAADCAGSHEAAGLGLELTYGLLATLAGLLGQVAVGRQVRVRWAPVI